MDNPGYVYLARLFPGRNLFKIGWSENPAKRVEQLRNAAVPKIELCKMWLGTRKDEGFIHQELHAFSVEREVFEGDLENLSNTIYRLVSYLLQVADTYIARRGEYCKCVVKDCKCDEQARRLLMIRDLYFIFSKWER